MNYEPFTSIENPTLAHFRHFRHFSSLYFPLYLSRILYKSALFMQNKPNSLNVRIYINIYATKNYNNFIPLAGQKNKPNSNPIKPNSQKAQMNVNSFTTEDYRKKDDFAVRKNKPNSNPIQTQSKPILCSRLKIPVCARVTCATGSSFTIIVYDFTRGNLQPFKGIKRMNVNFCTTWYYKSKPKALKKPPLVEVNSEPLRKDW